MWLSPVSRTPIPSLEVSGDSDPLVRPLIQLKSQSSTIDTVKAQEFLDIVWADSDARRQQFYSAVTSQVTGGPSMGTLQSV